jgi:polyisoprenoid-binding protein YceI
MVGLAATAHATTWKVDVAHTNVGFSVSHLFTSVHGRFDDFDGTIQFDPEKPEATVVRGTIEATSINTNNEKRDRHLRSSDFFYVEKYPTLSFESTGVRDVSGKQGKLEGGLTIRGVTRPVVIDAAFLGQGTDPWGNVRAGFTATLTINRSDFGLNWNELLETGGWLVGDEVEIRIDAEGLIQQ